jgi:hypothetical protein
VANIPKVWNGTAFVELEAAATIAPAASTTVVGIVQLTDSTSSTSTTTAATPNSVKSAYDLAGSANTTAGTAIPKNTVTAAGDILYASGSATVARLGIGTASQVLSIAAGLPSWTTLAAAGADVQEFTSSGSWVKPAGKSAVYVMCVGGGGGGASGGKAASQGLALGGNGGNGAGDVRKWLQASYLPGTVTVTIGLGGAGGTARTTNGVPVDGSDGGVTSFGTYAEAVGGFSGGANATMSEQYASLKVQQGRSVLEVGSDGSGTPRTVAAASTVTAFNFYGAASMSRLFQMGGMGNYSQSTEGRPSADMRYGTSGGGAGGEKAASNDAYAGGAGGRGFGFTSDTAAAGGTIGGGVGGNAGTVGYGNGGAGGGAGGSAVNGGAGGNGWLGGGGGGGGAAQTGNSGAGGEGGDGWILVISV